MAAISPLIRWTKTSVGLSHGLAIPSHYTKVLLIDGRASYELPTLDLRETTVSSLSMLAWQVRRIQDYIDRNITEPIKVSELCALVNRTPSHFSRTFKRAVGLSPHAYVLRRRIQLASQLLARSEMPLSEIALNCGFGDQSHLSNRFREHSGMTPAAWRRAHGFPLQNEMRSSL
jgi:AraC-like DNA-binding protein